MTGESGFKVSLGRRIAAFGVDYVFISLYMLLLVLVGVTVPSFTRVFETPFGGQAAGIVVLTLPVMLYFSLWEASRHAATPGKRALGVRVLRSTGERLTLGKASHEVP
ncbi:MAG TPA: RDD family protein [Longimicrobiales bacterium]|nr:RDD family protein [Longimicrobiales bacterium]